MWRISEHVTQVPIQESKIREEDAKKIVFPLMAENILEIYLTNPIENITIPYYDKRLSNAQNVAAKKGDSIIISLVPRTCSNVRVKLAIEDIICYSGNPFNLSIERGSLGSANILITTGGETPYHKPVGKYNITQPWVELISIDANTVYLTDAKYI